MNDILASIAFAVLGTLGIIAVLWCICWLFAHAPGHNAAHEDVRIIDMGGVKYVIVTNDHGVAICPVPVPK